MNAGDVNAVKMDGQNVITIPFKVYLITVIVAVLMDIMVVDVHILV